MKPPYDITSKILNLVSSISEKIGEIKAAHLEKLPPKLRKSNRIKSIQASLEIEGNTLTEEQITAIFDNKKIIAPKRDILEVKNAIKLYDKLHEFNPYSINSFLQAHKILMNDLIEKPGKFTTSSVGIVKGDKVSHLAPPPRNINKLMSDLFEYLKDSSEHIFIKSSVFHYELEFIHPFIDGNGRMGRLWQTLILMDDFSEFEYIPLETLIKESQGEYYKVLSESDKSGNSTKFIEYMLDIINKALDEILELQEINLTSDDRIERFRDFIGNRKFRRKDYLKYFKNISSATASRDLKKAVYNGNLEKNGDKNLTEYKFILGS